MLSAILLISFRIILPFYCRIIIFFVIQPQTVFKAVTYYYICFALTWLPSVIFTNRSVVIVSFENQSIILWSILNTHNFITTLTKANGILQRSI